MKILPHKVLEILSYPYFRDNCYKLCRDECIRNCTNVWCLNVLLNCYGIHEKYTLEFSTREEAESIKIGYIFDKKIIGIRRE